jgi:acetyltransferase-like isoleucine patch superfamily enzyme
LDVNYSFSPDLSPPPLYDTGAFPVSVTVGSRARIHAHRVKIGQDVEIGERVVLVGDEIEIGDNVKIAPDTDLRAASLKIGARTEISSGVRILVAEQFSIGTAARIAPCVQITCREFTSGKLLYLGDGANVGYGGTLTSTARVRIGNRVTIGQHTILNANCAIEIGDNVGTGSYLAIWTHGYHFGHGPLSGFEPRFDPVRIGQNVWLGFHVTILPGVSIGENTIIAAGSVVTASLPANVLAGGVPAKVKKALEIRDVSGAEVQLAVANVLHVWQHELEWKGCRILSASFADDHRCELKVAAANGWHQTRVVLPGPDETAPALQHATGEGETLVLVTVDSRPDLAALAGETTAVFCLRERSVTGCSSALIEDLRDQLRRYAMPCGEDACFAALDPPAFHRLRLPDRAPKG